MAVLFGTSILLRFMGVPWLVSTIAVEGRNPLVLGVLPLVGGLIGFAMTRRQLASARVAYDDYVAKASCFAEAVKSGEYDLADAPKRPGDVFGAHLNYTTTTPLEAEVISEFTNSRTLEVLADLLQPCGETQTLLGITQLRLRDEASGQKEVLEPVWVIDRIWNDGRQFSEWLGVLPRGRRLRLLGGASGRGPFIWATTHWDLLKSLIWPFICCGFAITASASFGAFFVMGLLGYGGKGQWQSQWAKFSEQDCMPDPFALVRQRFNESELATAKLRVGDALFDIIPPAAG